MIGAFNQQVQQYSRFIVSKIGKLFKKLVFISNSINKKQFLMNLMETNKPTLSRKIQFGESFEKLSKLMALLGITLVVRNG